MNIKKEGFHQGSLPFLYVLLYSNLLHRSDIVGQVFFAAAEIEYIVQLEVVFAVYGKPVHKFRHIQLVVFKCKQLYQAFYL